MIAMGGASFSYVYMGKNLKIFLSETKTILHKWSLSNSLGRMIFPPDLINRHSQVNGTGPEDSHVYSFKLIANFMLL